MFGALRLTTAPIIQVLVQSEPMELDIGNKTVYLGFSNAVSVANYAIAIAAGQVYEFPNFYTGGVWAISGSAAQSVNVVEMS